MTLLGDDENLAVCELAFQHFGTESLVVRLEDRTKQPKFEELGAMIVEPSTQLWSASWISSYVHHPQPRSCST